MFIAPFSWVLYAKAHKPKKPRDRDSKEKPTKNLEDIPDEITTTQLLDLINAGAIDRNHIRMNRR